MAGKRRSATKSAAKATSKAPAKSARSTKPERADARTARAGRGSLTHEDVMQASIRPDPELRRRSELLWEDRTPATRGPKAALTPDDVVRAAVDLADADGLSAVTMHAVAARVGFTTMAVYRYFPSKDALLDAVIDAGTGLPPLWSVPRADWRTEISRWAHAKRALLCARPWLAELPFVAAPHGPNWLAWLESIADSLSRTGLRGADIGQMLSIVDGYTRGASDTAVSLARARARGITEAVVIYLASSALLLGAAVAFGRLTGLYAGLGAMVISTLLQTAWLRWRARAALGMLAARDLSAA